MKMRHVVTSYLATQRAEVFLMTALLPSYLMFESALANGAIYAGGALGFDIRSLIAFGRGLGFEILTYACAKLFRLLLVKDARRNWPVALVPGIVALFCIVVSTGNNLAWVMSGGEMTGMLASLGKILPPAFMAFYQFGLGLVLPVSVGVVAVLDISHLIHEALDHSDLDAKGMEVAESEMHRDIYMRSQKKQKKQIEEAYDTVADTRAKGFVEKVKKGDTSFGGKQKEAPALRRVAPAAQGQLPLLGGPGLQQRVFPSGPQSQASFGAVAGSAFSPPSQGQVQPRMVLPSQEPVNAQWQTATNPVDDVVINMPTQGIGSIPTHGARPKSQEKLF